MFGSSFKSFAIIAYRHTLQSRRREIQVVDPYFTKLPSYLITPLNLNEPYDDVDI